MARNPNRAVTMLLPNDPWAARLSGASARRKLMDNSPSERHFPDLLGSRGRRLGGGHRREERCRRSCARPGWCAPRSPGGFRRRLRVLAGAGPSSPSSPGSTRSSTDEAPSRSADDGPGRRGRRSGAGGRRRRRTGRRGAGGGGGLGEPVQAARLGGGGGIAAGGVAGQAPAEAVARVGEPGQGWGASSAQAGAADETPTATTMRSDRKKQGASRSASPPTHHPFLPFTTNPRSCCIPRAEPQSLSLHEDLVARIRHSVKTKGMADVRAPAPARNPPHPWISARRRVADARTAPRARAAD